MRVAERMAALGACCLASYLVAARLLDPLVFSEDALVHQYWMWQWRDPSLFTDPLTQELRASSRYPDGYEALFRVAVEVTSPILFGEWLGIALMAVSGWLVFLIVREHTEWKPAAWIAAALFLAMIDIHRFYGGFPRAFVHPVVLTTALLAMRRHDVAAALVAAAGAVLYPPAAVLAVGVLGLSALGWSDGRPTLDRRRALLAAGALVLTAVAVIAPAGSSPRVFSAAEAREYPEFGPDGPLHFFAPSLLEYLRQNRSGFDLRAAGSVMLLATAALLLAHRSNWRLLRREVIALPVVALGFWAAAQAVLFELYLPHRYTYPIVAFLAIVVGVTARPTWEALQGRRWAFALLCLPVVAYFAGAYLFPLGPTEDPGRFIGAWTVGLAVAAVLAAAVLARVARPAAGAAVMGVALVVALLVLPDQAARGSGCTGRAVVGAIAALPPDAILAGDPNDLKCLPGTARRAVVISTQLAPAYEVDYFLQGRARMFASLDAMYGSDPAAIAALRERYGATHLWLRRDATEQERTTKRWHPRQNPYGRHVRRLLDGGARPAVLDLPAACRTFKRAGDELYDLACVASRGA